jgi:hypothetical protein
MKTIRIAFMLLATGALQATGWAAQTVPPLVNYQGLLVNSDNSPLANGMHQVQFRIFDQITGGTLIWGPQSNIVAVYNGQFNVLLGPTDGASRPLADAFKGANRYLELQVSNSLPISPRQQILSAPFALNAQTLNGTNWGAVFDNGDPATGKIPGSMISDGSISSSQIADGTIQVTDLGPINRLSASDGNPTNAVYVNANGYVGIGTTSPAYLMDVNQGHLAVRGIRFPPEEVYINDLPMTLITSNKVTLFEADSASVWSPPALVFDRANGYDDPNTCGITLTRTSKLRVYDADLILDENLYLTNLPSGTGVSYLVVDSAGLVKKGTTSSRRYKENIQPMKTDFTKILQLEAKEYVRRDNPGQKEVGYIAEDLDELGLRTLTTYDAQGRPEGIDYPRMVIFANEVLKEHRATIKKQQEELAALRAEMDALKKLVNQSR